MSAVTNAHDPVDRLAEDFLTRYRRGERPSVSEYARQFPDVADQVADVIQVMLLMENLGAEQDELGDTHHDPLPEKLGDYQIVRELGRGGMGVVYEAIQEELGRHVALKVLPSAALLKPNNLERFRREAKTAARLHHTNIVPVYGVGVQDGIHFYAMQFIQGQGLDTVLKEVKQQRSTSGLKETLRDVGAATLHSTISGHSSRHDYAQAVARIGRQIAEAVAHAHSQGVLHRDIKPSNILLDHEGTAWLSDFGLAQVNADEQLTGTGDIVGTLRYMAPERFTHQNDARSDIYSLGMTLYELLTLQPAYQGSDRAKLIHQILKEEPAALRSIDPSLPRDLETIVLKAITKEPEHRYQKAEELAEDLTRFLLDRPVTARRLRWWERSWRWVQRNRALSIMGTLAFMALAVGLGMTYWQWQRAEAEVGEKQFALNDAVTHRAKAEANAVLAWRGFRGILDGLSQKNNKSYEEIKKNILYQALQLHQAYLKEVEDLPRSLEMGRIASDLGLLYHEREELKNAKKYYHTAREAFEAVLRTQPGDREASMGLAFCLTNLARAMNTEAGRASQPPREALAPAIQSVELLRPIHQENPENLAVSIRLVTSLETLAKVNIALPGDWEANLREANQLMASWAPGQLTTEALQVMVRCHRMYASSLALQNRLDEAKHEAEAAYQAIEGFARTHPTDDDIQLLFANCSATLAGVFTKRNDMIRAEELNRRNIDIYRSLLQRNGENASFHNKLGGELNNLAMNLGKQNKVNEALDLIVEAIKEQRIALRQFPNHRDYLGFLYNHYRVQADLYLLNKDHLQASTAARQVATIPKPKGSNHYEAALLLCRAAELAVQDQTLSEQDRDKEVKLNYDQALAQLKTAVERGFSDKAKVQSDAFGGLKDRQDYRKLLAEMPAVSSNRN